MPKNIILSCACLVVGLWSLVQCEAGSGGGPGTTGSGSGGSASGGSASASGGSSLVDGGGLSLNVPDATGDVTYGCRNLQCQIPTCASGTTSISGTVYAPNGSLPLYNVTVYVPNAPLPAPTTGLSCDRCGGVPPGEPVAATLTDEHGAFKLEGAPAGTDIPLVLQVGKWRRLITIPAVEACQDTALTDPNQTRLPRNRSEGDMPRIAVTTGGFDNLVCLLPKLDIDPAEWGIAGEDKAFTFYHGRQFTPEIDDHAAYGALAGMTDASTLWQSYDELKKYDMAVFSCEGDEVLEEKGPLAYEAVTDYLANGGRVFGTDYQYLWYKYSPDAELQTAADIPGSDGNPTEGVTITLDTSFPKGKALADWRSFVDPVAIYGEVECNGIFENIVSTTAAVQVWGSSPASANGAMRPRILTINTPAGLPVDQQCGKAVHLDAHITTTTPPTELNQYPGVCGTELLDGEEVLAFFLFDLAACLQEESAPPVPPPVVQ
jgi:hypothetical protein